MNAPLGFSYIQRAAESVVEDLDRVVGGHRAMSGDEMSAKAVKVHFLGVDLTRAGSDGLYRRTSWYWPYTSWGRPSGSAGASRRIRRWCVVGLVLRKGVADFLLADQAVSYFKLAADLGDPDAQTELAFCYASGKGCKKDMRLAAKVRLFASLSLSVELIPAPQYYRLAVAQGGETFGLSWIYKVRSTSLLVSVLPSRPRLAAQVHGLSLIVYLHCNLVFFLD